MDPLAPLPPFSAVVVAAGKGLRADQPVPKQFALYCGKPVVRHSVESLIAAGANRVIVAIPDGAHDMAGKMLTGIAKTALVTGGETRQASVEAALLELESQGADCSNHSVLIHDAARPNLPADVIERLRRALLHTEGVIPVLPVVDSIAAEENGALTSYANREILRRVQTPQAFRLGPILSAHSAWIGEKNAGDDAQVLSAAGGAIAMVAGDERMKKLTFAEDFAMSKPSVRTGMGFDVHRLGAGEELWLGGIKIDHDHGLIGHSDADVALHALTDALLGAIGAGDIGEHFPPSDPKWKAADSAQFLEHAGKLVAESGYRISNVDLTIMCEAPKIGPHRSAMRSRIAALLGIDTAQVSVKATTTERLGFTGRGEGIAAQAIATVAVE